MVSQLVINDLKQQMLTTEVYACSAYSYYDCGIDSNNKTHIVPSIGIRRCIADRPERDPIIDEVPFMICGDIYYIDKDSNKVDKLQTVKELANADINYLSVILRGVSGIYPFTVVNLGDYRIVRMDCKTSEIIKLYLQHR